MKFFFTTFIFAYAFAISSCGDAISKYTQFNLAYTSKITIPANLGINLPVDLFTPEMETNSEAEFEVNDTRKDLIEEILLEECKMKITSPNGQTFGFLNSIHLYLNADGLDEILIAKLENIPENIGNEIVLDVEGKDFKDYIKKDNFTLKAKTITDKITNRDVDISINTKFFVDAKILGQ